VTSPGPLDHFDILTTDGIDPDNNLSVLTTHSLQVIMRDRIGNQIPTTGNQLLNISYTGTNPSPKGTLPVIPASGFQTYAFNSGSLTLTGLKLPNVTDNVAISVTDGTHTATPINPVLIIGPVTKLEIRDQDNNLGSDLSNSAFHVNTDTVYP